MPEPRGMLLCESEIQKKKGRKREGEEKKEKRSNSLDIFRELNKYLLQMAEDVNDGVADGLERRGTQQRLDGNVADELVVVHRRVQRLGQARLVVEAGE